MKTESLDQGLSLQASSETQCPSTFGGTDFNESFRGRGVGAGMQATRQNGKAEGDGKIVASSGDLLLAQIFSRICVRPPYFGLREPALAPNFVATVAAETDPRGECGPMTGAEFGRHGAIAGLVSVALSRSDSRRYYYLAREARVRFFENRAPHGTPVKLSAFPEYVRGRDVCASLVASAGESPLAEMRLTYVGLRDDLFARLFAARRREFSEVCGSYSDYARLVPVGPGEAMIESVPEKDCVGHFENYPALPIAVLMGQLIRLAGQTLSPKKFRVTSADVDADALVWAGESVRLRVKLLSTVEDHCDFDCTACVEERTVGHMVLGVSVV